MWCEKTKGAKNNTFCLGQREWLSCCCLRCGQKRSEEKDQELSFAHFELEVPIPHSNEMLRRWLSMGPTVPLY